MFHQPCYSFKKWWNCVKGMTNVRISHSQINFVDVNSKPWLFVAKAELEILVLLFAWKNIRQLEGSGSYEYLWPAGFINIPLKAKPISRCNFSVTFFVWLICGETCLCLIRACYKYNAFQSDKEGGLRVLPKSSKCEMTFASYHFSMFFVTK